MKDFIKIVEYRRFGNKNSNMIYKDEKGREFIGRPMNVIIGRLYVIEVSDKPLEDGYYHIIKVISS